MASQTRVRLDHRRSGPQERRKHKRIFLRFNGLTDPRRGRPPMHWLIPAIEAQVDVHLLHQRRQFKEPARPTLRSFVNSRELTQPSSFQSMLCSVQLSSVYFIDYRFSSQMDQGMNQLCFSFFLLEDVTSVAAPHFDAHTHEDVGRK